MSVRLGIERPDRPHEVVAAAEARVIEHELARRLGDVTVDLRIAGSRLGPWLPRDHAAWPADIDHRVDASGLWVEGRPSLATLFARTVDPAAADVRRRMLRHLDVIPRSDFVVDDEFLAGLPAGTLRPIDVWLIAGAASSIETDAVAAFSRHGADDGALDADFDALVASIDTDLAPSIVRLTSERDTARRDAQAAADDFLRAQADVADHLDALRAEADVLRERVERAELQYALDA